MSTGPFAFPPLLFLPHDPKGILNGYAPDPISPDDWKVMTPDPIAKVRTPTATNKHHRESYAFGPHISSKNPYWSQPIHRESYDSGPHI